MENNKFILNWSKSIGFPVEETGVFMQSIIKWIANCLVEDSTLCIAGFGQFDVCKQLEYVEVDKKSNKRILYPPKLYLEFTPAFIMDGDYKDNGVFRKMTDMLVGKHNIQPYIAEKISVSFFKTILEMMDEGENVEVDGLGGFLLTKVKVNDSVYGKVAFMADEKLSSEINSPFSFFSPVELSDGVHFDDLKENENSHSDSAAPDKVFLISKEPSDVPTEIMDSSKVEVSDNKEEEPTEDVDNSIPTADESEVTDSIDSENPISNKNKKYLRYAIVACVALVIMFSAWLLFRSNTTPVEDNAIVVAYSDTLVEEDKTDAPDTLSSDKVNDLQDDKSMDYAAMNAKIPYGGYDIVGVASVIEVTQGMTLQKIAKLYLGADPTVYLEVLNEGNKDPQPGQTYKIPKLKLRKK